uniref:CSON013399 protein n=1 Tax=Culicoides sonorensis TaxID=179676 RepID=A0A336M815_CULSO
MKGRLISRYYNTQSIEMYEQIMIALEEERNSPNNNSTGDHKGEQLNTKQRHQMKQRELFLSRQLETLPATHIRGKCSVTLLNEEESLLSYLNKDDTFFYCLVFDPTQKTLLADKGEIRVGSRYQSDIQALLKEGESDERELSQVETLTWTPHHSLTDRKIDQFLVVSRSVGTFARALDCSSSVKQPSLHMSAAAASRDITLFHAMDTLHKHNYSIEDAMCSLVASSGPVLCRDEMEEWSASEANLFEDALEKYGKDFNDIRNAFLPWKTLKSIVEYYYMWKTTDRYVQQKRVKAVEAESKLKQVYIPNYTKQSPALITNNKSILNGTSNGNGDIMSINGGKPCESCSTTSSQAWYSWGPSSLNCRLCQTCWNYWKRYGGLKVASRLADNTGETVIGDSIKKRDVSSDIDDERLNSIGHRPHRCPIQNCGNEYHSSAELARHYAHTHGLTIRSGSPRPIMKTRTAFYLRTNSTTRLSRQLCRHLIRSKKAARQPSYANVIALAIANKTPEEIKALLVTKYKNRGSVTKIADKLGNPSAGGSSEWLILTPKDKMPKPEIMMFPKPPKAPDGSLIYDRIPNKMDVTERVPINAQHQPNSLKKRHYEEINGIDNPTQPPPKRPNKDPMPSHRPTPEQYAAIMAQYAAAGQPLPRHHVINLNFDCSSMENLKSPKWQGQDQAGSKKARRTLPVADLRKAARKPWRNLNHHALALMHSALSINLPGTGTSITPTGVPAASLKPLKSSGDLQVVILD